MTFWRPEKIRQQVVILNNLPETTGVVYWECLPDRSKRGTLCPKMFRLFFLRPIGSLRRLPDGDY
jgi:hypothetical protein